MGQGQSDPFKCSCGKAKLPDMSACTECLKKADAYDDGRPGWNPPGKPNWGR